MVHTLFILEVNKAKTEVLLHFFQNYQIIISQLNVEMDLYLRMSSRVFSFISFIYMNIKTPFTIC